MSNSVLVFLGQPGSFTLTHVVYAMIEGRTAQEQISICHCLNDILYIILYISVYYAHLSCMCRSDIMFYTFEKTKLSENNDVSITA